MKISECIVIIPAHNEEENLPLVLEELFQQGIDRHMIVVVDSNSTDNTFAVAKRYGVRVIKQTNGKGKGGAVIEAIKHFPSECYVIMDGDYEHPAIYVNQLIELIRDKNCDYVVTERLNNNIRGPVYFIGNVILTTFFNIIWRTRFRDVMSGMLAFKPSLLGNIEGNNFCLEVELLSKALKKNLKICRLPIYQRLRVSGSKKLKVRHGLQIAYCTIKYRFSNS